MEVRTPDEGEIGFRVVSEVEGRLDEEVEIDLDGDGEANLVISRIRLSRYGEQLVTLRTRPGTFLAVISDRTERPPPGFGFEEGPPLRLPGIFVPGEVLERAAEVWAETDELYVAYLIRNTIWAPSGFRILDEGNHLGFRIGDRLGWVELAVVVDRGLQVEAVEILGVGLRVDPGGA